MRIDRFLLVAFSFVTSLIPGPARAQKAPRGPGSMPTWSKEAWALRQPQIRTSGSHCKAAF
jgi:hypothetical protein